MSKKFLFYMIVMFVSTGCDFYGKREERKLMKELLFDIAKLSTDEIMAYHESVDTAELMQYVDLQKWMFGVYTLASQDILRGEDLDYMSAAELSLVRNEIFARHGYRFSDTSLHRCFSKFHWYEPRYNSVRNRLTPLEEANIAYILQKEKSAADITDEEQFSAFLKNYFSGENRPNCRMLYWKFGVIYDWHYCMQLPETKDYVYLVYKGDYAYDYQHRKIHIYQYNRKGELVWSYDLGVIYNGCLNVQKKEDGNYELWYTQRLGAKDEHVKESVVRWKMFYNDVGEVILEKIEENEPDRELNLEDYSEYR